MDIQHLIDRLEDVIDEGRHWPMSKLTLIDEEKALGIIDQMRISVPEQIDTAMRVVAQRDRIIAQANEEAERIIAHARSKQDDMVDRDAVVVKAQHQAQRILDQAHRDAEQVRAETDAYVVDVLKDLEGQLLRTLTVVRNGIAKVMHDRESMQQARAIQQQPQQEAPATMPIVQREEVLIDSEE
jgi:hypothetical protein